MYFQLFLKNVTQTLVSVRITDHKQMRKTCNICPQSYITYCEKCMKENDSSQCNMQTDVVSCSWFSLRLLKKTTEKVIHTLLLSVRPPHL